MKPLALILVLAFLIAPAQAQHCWDDIFGYSCSSKRKVVRKKRYPKKEVRQYRAPDSGDSRRPVCVSDDVEVVSTEHTTQDNAMEAARKMWAFSTQWKWGSQYMALELADDFRSYCGQSNAMDTASGKLNEAMSSMVGKDGVNVRCIIRARPCRALLKPERHRDWDTGMKR